MRQLLPYLLVAALVVVTPGPDMALITRNAFGGGRRAAVMTSLGILSGIAVWSIASVIGVVAVLEASAFLFAAVKLAGAGYLVYLGARTLLSLRPRPEPARVAPKARRLPEGTPYQQGLLSNLLNPKIAVFFTSLIPQFIDPGSKAALQSGELAAIFLAIAVVWLMAFSIFAAGAGGVMRRPRVRRAIDAVTGTVLIGLGARLALERR